MILRSLFDYAWYYVVNLYYIHVATVCIYIRTFRRNQFAGSFW